MGGVGDNRPVPSALPDGDPAPADGALPPAALAAAGTQPLGVYLHVPFCATRCGYCDFTTYTATELAAVGGQTISPDSYVELAATELRLAARVLDGQAGPAVTVFLGGGTPTLLPAAELGRLRQVVADELGLAPEAEVSTEANPESVDPRYLDELRAAGFTRVSFGMQSVAEHVLAQLDRRHTPGRAVECVGWAHAAGFTHVNLDLIYGAPAESESDWRASLRAAIDAGPDHVSAYSLIVEPGTRLAARVRRGELRVPEEDALAERYLVADELLSAAGLDWYEVSNWAAGPEARSRHNRLYWTGAHWWGIGPGAHSHVGGVRWWNHKHPRGYAEALRAGRSPAAGRELLEADQQRTEQVMLELRLVEGLDLDVLTPAGRLAAARAAEEGLLDPTGLAAGRAVLTRRGRLLADAVVRDLLPE